MSALAAFALALVASESPVTGLGESANPRVADAAARADQLAAIAKGLEYLAAQQSRELGAVGSKYQVAVTSLAADPELDSPIPGAAETSPAESRQTSTVIARTRQRTTVRLKLERRPAS